MTLVVLYPLLWYNKTIATSIKMHFFWEPIHIAMLWALVQHASWLPTDDRPRKEGFVALKYFLHFWSLEFIHLKVSYYQNDFMVSSIFQKTTMKKFDEYLPYYQRLTDLCKNILSHLPATAACTLCKIICWLTVFSQRVSVSKNNIVF